MVVENMSSLPAEYTMLLQHRQEKPDTLWGISPQGGEDGPPSADAGTPTVTAIRFPPHMISPQRLLPRVCSPSGDRGAASTAVIGKKAAPSST
jgi:hypothetical protein